MFLINAPHGQLQLLADLHLPYAVGSHFLMGPYCMWQHMKSEVVYRLQSYEVTFVCVTSYGRNDVIPVMLYESF